MAESFLDPRAHPRRERLGQEMLEFWVVTNPVKLAEVVPEPDSHELGVYGGFELERVEQGNNLLGTVAVAD